MLVVDVHYLTYAWVCAVVMCTHCVGLVRTTRCQCRGRCFRSQEFDGNIPTPFIVLHPLFHRSLFIQIVERLLIEKPDNPIGFIVEYLAKRYPEETRAAKVGHSIQRENSAGSHVTAASR